MNYKLALAGSALAFIMTDAAYAQTAASAAAPQDTTAQATDTSGRTVEEIVVTAQRRSENLQRVPVSVSAVTAASVQAMGIKTTGDLTAIAPSFNFQQLIGSAAPFIRGVGTSAAGSPGQENSVAIYVDGVYISAQTAGLFSLNNIERIEVLKGPQSTLFGRNATGGLVQIITRDPSHVPEVQGTISYGNFQTVDTKLYGTTGLTDTLAIDFAGSYTHQGKGWGTNLATGRDVNKTPLDLSLRSKLLFTPGNDTRITLAGDYQRTRTSIGVATKTAPGAVNALGYSVPGGFWDTSTEQTPLFKVKSGGASLKIEQNLNFARLVSITAYRESQALSLVDFLSNPQRGIVIALNAHEREFTQELQILSPDSSPIKWIAGVFYYNNLGESNPFDLSIYPVLTGLPGPITNRIEGRQLTRSISGFAQATFPLTETTRLTTGFRYTRDQRSTRGTAQTLLSFAPVSPPAVDTPRQSSTSSKPTWRISLDQDLGEHVLGYASYNRGFKSGLYNLQQPGTPPLKPEKIDAYEVGVKADLFDRVLRINTSAFYYDYSNIQILRAEGGTTQLLNGPKAKIYGLDFEGTLIPVQGLTLRAGLGLLHSRYGDFPNAVLTTPIVDPVTGVRTGGNTITTFNAKGKHTVLAPDYTLNLSATYEHTFDAGKLGATVGYYRSGRRYFEVDNRLSQKPYDLLSGEVSWALPGDHFRFRVFGRNLTNAKIFNQLTEQGVVDGAVPDAPRTYGVAVDFHF